MKHLTRTLGPALLLIAAAALTACGGEKPEALIASAKEFLVKEDARSAIIQVKTALQADPDNAEARFLHGKALLLVGNGAAAVIELRKALDLRHPEEAVVPELARALLAQGEHLQLSEQFGQTALSDPLAQADLKVTLALSYGSLGRRDLAQRAVEASLQSMPDYGPAKVFEARLQADGGDVAGALATIEAQIQRQPQDHDAWQLKGDLLNHGNQDADGAMAAYKQAIAAQPDLVPAHTAVMTMLLARQEVAAAREHLVQLQKALPNHPQTRFFTGTLALLDKDLDKAREIAQSLLRLAPENPRVLQLAGAVEFELKSYLQAESLLSKALQKIPGLDTSRRLLALTYLRVSEPAKALSVLQPLLDRPNPGAPAYALLAQAHLQAGDLDKAMAAFTQAAKLNPDDTRSHTALALSKVMRGNDAGLADLRGLAAKDDTITADLPLIGALVQKKDFAGAMKAIDALEGKTPGQPIAANLRARVLMMQDNPAAARQAFEQALQLQPNFYPAASALAQLAIREGRPEEAQRRMDDVLKADPGNMQALLASARLKAATGAPREEVVRVFTAAVQNNNTLAAPRLALINYHLSTQQTAAALSVAQTAAAALPNDVDVLEALGRAQAASGDVNQAEASFSKLAQLRPQSALPHLRLSELRWSAGNRDAAVQSLRRALAVEPENLTAQRALVDAYVSTQRPAEAVAVAREVQKQRPTQDVGFVLEGGIEAAQKRWDRALELYARGLKVAPDSTDLATRMHVALMASQQTAAADRHAAAWVRAHPDDAGFHFFLGDTALARQRLPEAETHYRNVLKVQPDNALALNNVAWLMATAKKPGAVEMARKATALLPNRPVILDTLAVALASEGQLPESVDVMKQAVALEQGNPHLRFNLAKLHAQAGNKAAARAELNTLAALGDKFPRQGEVAELLKTL